MSSWIHNKESSWASDILKTGWQSWSTKEKSRIKWPVRNYLPFKEEYLPNLPKDILLKKPAFGWCSWYHLFWRVNEKNILGQANWFAMNRDIPVEYILLDGGWTKSGDWDHANKVRFPHGMKYLAGSINDLDLKPGIWVEPFLVDSGSDFAKENKELLAHKKGKLVDGYKLFGFGIPGLRRYILDVRKREAMDYLHNIFKYLFDDCGFQMIKLDFLYALYFIPSITANEAGSLLRDVLLHIQKKYPKVYTIGCGCPLVPAIGAVDSMRIGPDIIFPCLDGIPLTAPLQRRRINSVMDTVKRLLWMRRYWNLDPDVYVCRRSIGVADKKLLALQNVVKEASGNIFLGDDMTKLKRKRIQRFIMPLFEGYASPDV